MQILCCAPSNDPTNHLAVQLAKYLPDYEVTRVNSGRVIHEELPSDVRKLTMHYKLQSRFKSQHYKHDVDFEEERDGRDDVVRRSHIICTTCNVRPQLVRINFSVDVNRSFNTFIVAECRSWSL